MKQSFFVSATVVAFGLALTSPVLAGKIYTPEQLHSMVESGKFPAQGTPSTQSENMDYGACIAKVESIVASVRKHYPTQKVLSTDSAHIEKIWKDDSTMTLTCNAPAGKLITTTAPYL
ncbi:MAG: hypothetical protein ACU4EQ_12020 [Candidatus Nitrosoglobus sp.]|jgi:hypothetical protein